MERHDRPAGRQTRVTGNGKGVSKRGEGLNLGGPAGNAEGYGESFKNPRGRASGGTRSGGSRGPVGLLGMLAMVACLLFGGGSFLTGGLAGDLGGGNGGTVAGGSGSGAGSAGGAGFGAGGSGLGTGGSGLGMAGSAQTPSGSRPDGTAGCGVLNPSVAQGARQKRTVLKGDGQDSVTVMIYMCGTDLESKNGMATADLKEMMAAKLGGQVNVLVYTGGCTGWRNQQVSSAVNQIYQVKDGGLTCLERDMGDASMTNPETLAQFIRWCQERYPANRRELIFWDHGGGSASGYGYDQKHPGSGSMTLAGINQALKAGGTTFDFIGFDACLMATLENALMLGQYGDYMIASEETEPGYGWYYTDWLTKLSENPSMPTLEIGRQIADDFVRVCAQNGQGSSTTLSLVDLSELEATAPGPLAEFARSASRMIQDNDYQAVSDARSKTKEFARSTGIDQVDLVNLAQNMGTEEGARLAEALQSAVKYNRTSPGIANAYGISIYFPYKKVSSVDRVVKTYEQIGMDADYGRCIQEFASLEVAGQAMSGGASSPLPSLMGTIGSLAGNAAPGGDVVAQILGALLSGSYGAIPGLDGSNVGFLSGRSLETLAEYVTTHRFDAEQLVWQENGEGLPVIRLEEEQWKLIQTLELNAFYDDGEGYIDLGLDNVFRFDEDGSLLGDYDRTWLAINGQPVAYYFLEETRDGEDYTITGRVPAMLNGERVELMLVFDQDNPYGRVAGARTEYEGQTQTIAKGLTQLRPGDTLEFICDYYGYDGTFQNNYYLGEPMTVGGEMEISNVDVGEGKVRATYRFTDLYNQHYWTPALEGLQR